MLMVSRLCCGCTVHLQPYWLPSPQASRFCVAVLQALQHDVTETLEVLCAVWEASQCQCRVLQHTWGTAAGPLHPPFDYVVACGDQLSAPAMSEALCVLWPTLPYHRRSACCLVAALQM